MNSHQTNNREKVILVAEELLSEICLLILQLQKCGYRVISVNSSKNAVSLAVTQFSELILLNTNISDLNGDRVCQILKAQQQTVNILVILFGDFEFPSSQAKAFQVGGADYIS
jgi:PleD family two-component response regulator